MTIRSLLLVAVLPLALRAQDTTAAKASLLAADRAAAASELVLASALMPTAVVLLPDLAILRGQTAFAPYLGRIAGASGRKGWTPVHAVVSRDGTFGCTTGVLHLVAIDTMQPTTGRYAACWRHLDGVWRMLALTHAAASVRVKVLPESLAGAPASSGVSAPTGSDAAAEITQTDRSFAQFSADSGGPSAAFSRWIAVDGMMLVAQATPVRGPVQARDWFAGFPANGRFEFGPVDALTSASADGSLGFTVGEALSAATPAKVFYSKYLTVWRREADGSYRFIFDTGSYRPAPARR